MNKPGYKTTEFWLSVAAFFIGALLASGVVTHDPTLQGLGLIASALSALGYEAGRSLVKSNEAKSMAVLAAAKAAKPSPQD